MTALGLALIAVPLLVLSVLTLLAWRRRRSLAAEGNPWHLRRCIRRDGELLAVMRPADPERALRVARGKVRAVRDKSALGRLLGDPKNVYTLVGLLLPGGHIADPLTGEDLGRTHAGDSFVGYDLIADAIKSSEAAP